MDVRQKVREMWTSMSPGAKQRMRDRSPQERADFITGQLVGLLDFEEAAAMDELLKLMEEPSQG